MTAGGGVESFLLTFKFFKAGLERMELSAAASRLVKALGGVREAGSGFR